MSGLQETNVTSEAPRAKQMLTRTFYIACGNYIGIQLDLSLWVKGSVIPSSSCRQATKDLKSLKSILT